MITLKRGSDRVWTSQKLFFISAEARGEPYIGQVAVGAVVLNRVESSSFPDSISGVVYQPGAFTAITDGQINEAVTESARRAAQEALNGSDPTGGALYYYNPKLQINGFVPVRLLPKSAITSSVPKQKAQSRCFGLFVLFFICLFLSTQYQTTFLPVLCLDHVHDAADALLNKKKRKHRIDRFSSARCSVQSLFLQSFAGG